MRPSTNIYQHMYTHRQKEGGGVDWDLIRIGHRNTADNFYAVSDVFHPELKVGR